MDQVKNYEAPQVVDYGDLQTLTASCGGGHNGDALFPAEQGGITFGPSNPAGGCTSNP